jgi:hypothetical protein
MNWFVLIQTKYVGFETILPSASVKNSGGHGLELSTIPIRSCVFKLKLVERSIEDSGVSQLDELSRSWKCGSIKNSRRRGHWI